MSTFSKPCISCGRELRNVSVDSTNQPSVGTSFQSYGHYGSTAYDPMDGRYLEINLCDLCLVLHADRVMEGRNYRPVVVDGSVTGMEKMEKPWRLVAWQPTGKELDHVLEAARKEFELASDEPSPSSD